jgi:uncharacterized protein DUF6159
VKRFGRGWRLAGRSLRVLRGRPSLALFPAVSGLVTVVTVAVLLAPGVVWAAVADVWWIAIPFAVVWTYAATFCAVYFNVALAGAVALSLDRRSAGLRDGLEIARGRRGAIARWALVAATVGLVLQAVQAVAAAENPVARLAGAIVTSLGGAAWAIATFFVVPILALEGIGPRAALARSVALVRERWGESVGGAAAITIVVVLAGLVPAAALVAVAVSAGGSLAIVAGAVAVVIVIAATVVGTALSVIFRVVLYRFAADGRVLAGFAPAELEGAFGSPVPT